MFRNVFFNSHAARGLRGFYVDSGANDWQLLSNTLFYDKCLGWGGLCLEPDPQYAAGLARRRSCTFFPECISDRERHVTFKVDRPVALTEQEGLVDDRHDFADLDELVEILDILGIEPHATMADTHAHPIRLVGAVNQVPGHLELQDTMPERVIRSRRHDRR